MKFTILYIETQNIMMEAIDIGLKAMQQQNQNVQDKSKDKDNNI